MAFLDVGQRINIDVSGLRLSGGALMQSIAAGVVVDVAPGAITARLELDDGGQLEVTVSPQRIGQ
jgi:hypothetical protein